MWRQALPDQHFHTVWLQIQNKQPPPKKKTVCGLLGPEDESTMMLQNGGNYLPNCTA